MRYFMKHKKNGKEKELTEKEYNDLNKRQPFSVNFDFRAISPGPNFKGLTIEEMAKKQEEELAPETPPQKKQRKKIF
jgi:hypothetical protein